jgi:23S rRNA pseudouridine2605 synthase
VTELGTKVDPGHDEIRVDGQLLPKQSERPIYIMLNKPRNVLSAASDDRGRQTVLDLVDTVERIYPVGRLDLPSEGLILLTNDGQLTQKLTHPRHGIEKEYHVLVTGKPTIQALIRWRNGEVEIGGRLATRAVVERLKVEGERTWLKVVLTEGRKRQIRETAKALGYPVKSLKRVRIGPLRLGNLKVGQWRYLNPTEIDRLKKAVS